MSAEPVPALKFGNIEPEGSIASLLPEGASMGTTLITGPDLIGALGIILSLSSQVLQELNYCLFVQQSYQVLGPPSAVTVSTGRIYSPGCTLTNCLSAVAPARF